MIRQPEIARPLAYPEREAGAVGFICTTGLSGVTIQISPEDFTTPICGVIYEAAIYLKRRGKTVGTLQLIEAIESDRTLARIAADAAKAEGSPDWKNSIFGADSSLAYNPAGGEIVTEFLEDIAEAASRRRAIQIGQRLAAGEISSAEAMEELQSAPCKVSDWSADMIPAEELCSKARAEDFKKTPVIIEDMLAQGDLSLLTAGSKSFKSWIALQVAISVANGIPILGRQTVKTKTLVLNFELKPASIRQRLTDITSRLGCGVKNLTVWNLRNREIMPDFLGTLTSTIKSEGFGLVLLDPLYSMYGVVSDENVENSNPAMTALLGTIRSACEEAGAACIIVHHHSKGDSSSKASIDRSSGAGALGRFPDSIISLVKHEAPQAYVVETDFRDFPPCEPFVIRRENGIMVLDVDLNPASKKRAKAPANQKIFPEDVVKFVPTEGTIERKPLKAVIVESMQIDPKTADRAIEHSLQLKLCYANRHGIFRKKQESQTMF